MEKKALDMFLDGWCKDCATDYSECAILGICKASVDDDEKQIEEIARALCPYEANKNYYKSCELCHKARMTGCDVFNKAQEVYRKILPENSVVLTKEEYNNLKKIEKAYDPFWFCTFGGCEGVCKECKDTCKMSILVQERRKIAREIIKEFKELQKLLRMVSLNNLIMKLEDKYEVEVEE